MSGLQCAQPIEGAARVVLLATADAARADTYRTHFFLGGSAGLRGYQIGSSKA